MIISTDQLGRTISLREKPTRIISLVPSQTELLYDLGLDEEVVGITKFCVHPKEWFQSKTRVGGTKKIDFEKIKSLQPDLIIGNKEENEEEQIRELMKHYLVWMSDIKTLEDALDMINRIGELVVKKDKALELIRDIKINFQSLLPYSLFPSTAYLIWREPIMTVGTDTFIHDMLKRCGFKNVFTDKKRYPEVSEKELQDANPNLILLSSEPYPFKEKHIAAFQSLCPDAKVMTVDGEMFSWYGSRLLKAPGYFKGLIQQTSA
jgi:ABC-type Fe3+-hydroxamate transport system substrate-binding protein